MIYSLGTFWLLEGNLIQCQHNSFFKYIPFKPSQVAMKQKGKGDYSKVTS